MTNAEIRTELTQGASATYNTWNARTCEANSRPATVLAAVKAFDTGGRSEVKNAVITVSDPRGWYSVARAA